MLNKRLMVLVAIVLGVAFLRLIPHPPNFAPAAALALFAGAHFRDNRTALLLPLAAMMLSDLLIGLHGQMLVIYGCFTATVGIGMLLRDRIRIAPVAAAAIGSSVLFFAVTNLAVWALDGLYPLTLEGLLACYVAAIPFFQNTLLGTAFYTVVLFGGFALAERWSPGLRAPAARSA
ncbi:MAG: hypothetical protein GWN84_05815 [Gammaproteobacteria bacterium]|nr:hypothetical protein [Gammaproteobacteria bacterium]NIR82495.1 hypothetical protein [Gammaproteobacteria bacterium]NIR88491.1 hypothetical protein [Gammaproteobacteria bacterium]NIU03631.1 hypothetical protein [Gammaproteobacteria bacterium]NIV50983.1 hypothetical protein [Gammaproteobacteria bacterium]